MGLWTNLAALLLDALSPPACCACDAPSLTPFCTKCGHVARLAPSELVGVPLIVAGSYAPPLSTAIARFKYGGRPELSRPLAQLLAPSLRSLDVTADAPLVPVPLHKKRLAERGYNQAALLAQELGRNTGRACRPRLLARTRETERQVGKTRRERLTNAQSAFELRQTSPRCVVLVDDVVTTGSTVRACAQALAGSGVQLAAVVALARAGDD
jgi:ComF family protein